MLVYFIQTWIYFLEEYKVTFRSPEETTYSYFILHWETKPQERPENDIRGTWRSGGVSLGSQGFSLSWISDALFPTNLLLCSEKGAEVHLLAWVWLAESSLQKKPIKVYWFSDLGRPLIYLTIPSLCSVLVLLGPTSFVPSLQSFA